MDHEFKHYSDAYAAGYRRPSKQDKDVSGHNFFGYDYESPDGELTVTVWFTEEKNKLGQLGCFMAMFPPKV